MQIAPLPKDSVKIKKEIKPIKKIIERPITQKLNPEIIPNLTPSPSKKFAPVVVTSLTIDPIKKKSIHPKILTNPLPKKVLSGNLTTTAPVTNAINGYPNLGKLNSLISDPGIENIECIGPNKNVIVKKHGRLEKTGVLLTNNEIKQIIQDFSVKTKIPLVRGTFKAVLENLILTAVISEFAGTKFILQKKNPTTFKMPL